MALSEQQKNELFHHAEEYVENHIECNPSGTEFIVDSNTCYSLDKALEEAMKRCKRPQVSHADAFKMDEILKRILREKIEALLLG